MFWIQRLHMRIAILVLALPLSAQAELQIDSLQSGILNWSGATPGTTNWIQWAPLLSPTQGWQNFESVLADSTVMSAEVPFFYRVLETPPTNPVPSRFDARDQGWVTPVKSQIGNRPDGSPDPGNSIGICWAMSAMAVFEGSLLKQGITTDPNAAASSFSPWHLGNAVGQPPLHYNEPCYTYYGDELDIPLFVTDPPTTYGYLAPNNSNGWGGGQVFWLLDYLLTGVGPVLESDSLIPVADMTAHNLLVWSNPSPPVAGFLLRGAYEFDPDDYTALAEFRAAAKETILSYGSIQSYMLVLSADFPDVSGLTFYDTNTCCIYNPRENLEPRLNHAITVIGWDDEFPVAGAPAPGAWLIKESLGTQVYSNGYNWIAYEDQTFMQGGDLFYTLEAASSAGYDWPGLLTHTGALTRFDLMTTAFQTTGSSMWGQDSQGYAVFPSLFGGELKAIGWVTVNPNEEVSIDLYSGMDAQLNPTNLLASQTVTLKQRGYHLVDLDAPLSLAAGSDLIVSLTYTYQDQNEPLVYVSDTNLPPAETYLLTYCATSALPSWVATTNLDAHGSLFLQAVFADP